MSRIPFLSEDEQKRTLLVISDIEDNIKAIRSELDKKHSYKYYLREKIDKIRTDINWLESIIEGVDDNDT